MEFKSYCPKCCTIQSAVRNQCIKCGEKLIEIIIEVQDGDTGGDVKPTKSEK